MSRILDDMTVEEALSEGHLHMDDLSTEHEERRLQEQQELEYRQWLKQQPSYRVPYWIVNGYLIVNPEFTAECVNWDYHYPQLQRDRKIWPEVSSRAEAERLPNPHPRVEF